VSDKPIITITDAGCDLNHVKVTPQGGEPVVVRNNAAAVANEITRINNRK